MKPAAKNAYKFELFNFDILPLAESYCLFEVDREEEFAPIKNNIQSSVNDTPRTAIDLVAKLHQKWLIQAGYTFEFIAAWDRLVEVDPAISYAGEDIQSDTPNKCISTFPFYLKCMI